MTVVPHMRLGIHVWGSMAAMAAMLEQLATTQAVSGLGRKVSCNWRQAALRNGRSQIPATPWPTVGRAWSTHVAVVDQVVVGPRLRMDHALAFLRDLVAAAGTNPAAAIAMAWDPALGHARQAGKVFVAHGPHRGARASAPASRSSLIFIPEQTLARLAGGPIANRIAVHCDSPTQLEQCFLAGFAAQNDLRDYLAAAGAAAHASDLHERLPATAILPAWRL